ncbi:MAG: hypothetical protein NTY81_02345 [Candidatus Staskawiczbacteria bacterium]|nr:hypothetical protein [Candidatus Staskawiczbacteria bacterium]
MNTITYNYKEFGVPSTEPEIKFDVYQNYFKCFRRFIEGKYGGKDQFVNFLWEKLVINKLSGSIDENIIKRFLYIGWNTEFLSSMNDNENIELLKINNHWKPIQSYYAVYSVGEALGFLIDKSTQESHSGCIKKLNTFLVEKIGVIEPWSFAYKGTLRHEFSPINFPIDVKLVNSLSRGGVRSVDMISTCLKAEHINMIEDFKPQKTNKKQKELGMAKKLKKDYDPGYTTILDFLYRLRIKSNYKDVEIFITDAPDDKIKGFSHNLSFVVSYTLTLFEIIIIKRYGLNRFLKLAEDYCKNLGKQENDLSARLKLYNNLKEVATVA